MSEALISSTPMDRLQSGQSSLVMQSDGNLVLYNGKSPLWASNTAGQGKAPFKAIMQSDGNFVVYDASNAPTWASGTNKGAGKYALALQGAKIALLFNSAIVWSSDAPAVPPPAVSPAVLPASPTLSPMSPALSPAPPALLPGVTTQSTGNRKNVRGTRSKGSCSCNVNVSPLFNANGQCPMCNKRVASPRSALKTLQQKAWELSASPSVVVPARSDQGSIGIRLQTLADQVASLSTEYNGLPQGGLAPIGFESFINF